MNTDFENQDYITIGKAKIPIKKAEIEQSKLKFWKENPRVYSALNAGDGDPSQEEIEKVMCARDHVKKLKESIKTNGGLIDPVIVLEGQNIVLEGNSRLAAYRLLFSKDPIKWAKIKVVFLPQDTPESTIFTLIGQYHIIGRKDWEPYEQAGYLYRTIKHSEKTPEQLAQELGIKSSEVKRLIEIYEYMISKDDNNPSKWSHYEELLKNRGIKKAFKAIPELEDKIVEAIKCDEIKMAIDLRKLGDIGKVEDKLSKKTLKEIASGEEDIYSGYEIIQNSGKLDNNYQIVCNFRKKICDNDFAKKLLNDEKIDQIEYELHKINRQITILLNKIKNN